MASLLVFPQGQARITVPANQSVAVHTDGTAHVYQVVGYPNHPDSENLLGTVTAGQTVFGPYASGATILINAGAAITRYEVGTAPQVEFVLAWQIQGDPVAVNTTGAVSAAAILGGLVTSTTAAAVAGTIPTGAAMDLASDMAVGDSVDWAVINTGPNTFTVTAASGHTIVGTATVVTLVSGLFRTRKTAADTFITYRLS